MTVVSAHISGTIWEVEVEVGDVVQVDDAVATIESMKMEMPVEAEVAGTVVEIHVEKGQAVNEGDPVVTLG